MNYGDGWYGGVFVGAMYALAFVESDIEVIVEQALKTIPRKSKFRQRLSSVLRWYRESPDDWKRTWQLYNEAYSEDIGCPELVEAPGNIDATMNAAYVAMGLLFGHGDFGRTIDIATRCGQDSDCNPSTAGGVLATVLGYSHIPKSWMANVREVEDIPFAYTDMSLSQIYQVVFDLALQQIRRHGGQVTDTSVTIRSQRPKAVRLEQGFPHMHPQLLVENLENIGTERAAQNTFAFSGKGIAVYGNVSCPDRTYEAELEVCIDGRIDRVMNLPVAFLRRTADCLYWNYDLPSGSHQITFRLLNDNSSANIRVGRIITYSQ